MKITVWTVAADDDMGTRATVHVTEKDAWEQWIECKFSSETDADELSDRATATSYISRGDFIGLQNWQEEFVIGEPLDTYAIEVHQLEIPLE